MLGYIEIVPIYFFNNLVFSIKARRGLLCGVWLRAVSVSLRGDNLFREYLRKNKCLRKIFLTCLSEAQMSSIHEKKCQTFRDTATLHM